MENKVPNFDAMTPGELKAFADRYSFASQKEATELVGRRPKATVWATTLAVYAASKATAMKAREGGDIFSAQRSEDRCERIYRDLPADLRW